jgi:hypothetical protein
MARKESCAGMTLEPAVDDIPAFFEVPGRERFGWFWVRDEWRHTCGRDAEEKTTSHRANLNNKRSLWTICIPWSKIAMHRDAAPGGKDAPDCRGEDAPRDLDRNVQILRRGICRRTSSLRPCSAGYEAASTPWSRLHTVAIALQQFPLGRRGHCGYCSAVLTISVSHHCAP